MATYTHGETGVKVSVADEKVLGPDWVRDTDDDKRSTRGKKKSDKS